MALVVFVFATVLMLAAGLRADAGRHRAARQRHRDPPRLADRGAERHRPRAGGDRREHARDRDAARTASKLVSKEPVVLINLPKRDTRQAVERRRSAASRRAGLALRPQVQHRRGRMFRPGTSEIIAGRAIAERLPAAPALGETLRFAQRDWTVVGMFDAGRTRLRFRDLGRRRAADAGVPPRVVFVAWSSGSPIPTRFDDGEGARSKPTRG